MKRPWTAGGCSAKNKQTAPQWTRASSFSRLHDHTQTQQIGRTALDKYSALTKHNGPKAQTSILPARFEATIPTRERPQSQASGLLGSAYTVIPPKIIIFSFTQMRARPYLQVVARECADSYRK